MLSAIERSCQRAPVRVSNLLPLLVARFIRLSSQIAQSRHSKADTLKSGVAELGFFFMPAFLRGGYAILVRN